MHSEKVLDAQVLVEMKGDFYPAIEILEELVKVYSIEYKPKVYHWLGFCYQHTGHFFKALEIYKKLSESSDSKLSNHAKQVINVIKSPALEIGKPRPNNFSLSQSKPDKDGVYPESKSGIELFNASPKVAEKKIEELKKAIENNSNINKETISFDLGEYYFLSHDYQTAFNYFLKSAKLNPNKAIYWGFAAQSHFKFSGNHLKTLILLENAIDLDPLNAVWFEYQTLTYSTISIQSQDPMSMRSTITAGKKAISLMGRNEKNRINSISLVINQNQNLLNSVY